MPRRLRRDFEGAWWHITNRGVAQRAIFESRHEFLRFLALLACSVRRERLEIHAYCLMDNHFHLLVRSPHGDISAALQRIEDAYARWFNLRHDRDGPLFRGRFRAKLILTKAYRRAVIGYIHDNPVRAGIVTDAEAYPFSSARDYARGRGRPWLARDFGQRLDPAVRNGRTVPIRLVRAWLRSPTPDEVDLDELLLAKPAHVQRWLGDRARRADGVLAARVLVLPATLKRALDRAEEEAPLWRVAPGRRSIDAWEVLRVGLLRHACALSIREIAHGVRASVSTVQRRARLHVRLLGEDGLYAERSARVLHAALREDYDAWRA